MAGGTDNHEGQGGVAEEVREKVEPPKRYKVIMHNDDYTTMEFVIIVLIEIFRKPDHEAFDIMMQIHHEGSGIAGVYPLDIAETKISQAHDRAREAGYPLRCTLEEE